MSFRIVRNDIAKMNTEAIVNTANPHVAVGRGCDSAIYNAAGFDELLEYRREHIGDVPEGEAFITPGFGLSCRYIIHAVSPHFDGGSADEEKKLRSCYQKSLALAKEHGVKSIAFPLISTGSLGYPKEEGIRIAADEIYDFLFDNEMDVYLVVYDEASTALGAKIYPDLESYIEQNYIPDGDAGDYTSAPPAADMECQAAPTENFRCTQDAPRHESGKAGRMGIFRRSAAKTVECTAEFAEAAEDEDVDLSDIDNVEILEARLNERLKHLSDTFSEYLLFLIESKGMTNADAYKGALVDKKTFSKIKNDKYYHPHKITALCLCIGAQLNLDESRDLLARAGYALSPCDMTDIIFSFHIENGLYDMTDIDIELEERGLPCIIQ